MNMKQNEKDHYNVVHLPINQAQSKLDNLVYVFFLYACECV